MHLNISAGEGNTVSVIKLKGPKRVLLNSPWISLSVPDVCAATADTKKSFFFFLLFCCKIQDISVHMTAERGSSIWLRSTQHMLDDMTSGLASYTQSFGEAGWKHQACLCSCKWKSGGISKWVAWHIFPMQLVVLSLSSGWFEVCK